MDPESPTSFDFSGTIDHIQLVDVIQLACPTRKSLTFRVKSDQRCGDIHIREGQVSHVEIDSLQGEEALFEMLLWDRGYFEASLLQKNDVSSIHKPWEYLLIDAMRFCDEKASGGDEDKIAEATSTGSFSGIVNNIQLVDIVQLVCIIRTGHLIEVRSGKQLGQIFVRSGQVQHALTGMFQGEEAVYQILGWKSGSFKALLEHQEITKTIGKPWEYLIIEAMRRRDQEAESAEDDEDGRVESLAHKILRMKTGAKIRLAMTGDREARNLLLRDGNRVVQTAIISNPKITESEVALLTYSKNADEEVLRKIANNREWMKSYQIRLALVKNPKAPLATSIKLVQTLLPQDLKLIAKSKSVPSALSHVARRLLP